MFEELFYKHPPVASREVIVVDVQGLPKLFQEVIEKKGGWASKAFRCGQVIGLYWPTTHVPSFELSASLVLVQTVAVASC